MTANVWVPSARAIRNTCSWVRELSPRLPCSAHSPVVSSLRNPSQPEPATVAQGSPWTSPVSAVSPLSATTEG